MWFFFCIISDLQNITCFGFLACTPNVSKRIFPYTTLVIVVRIVFKRHPVFPLYFQHFTRIVLVCSLKCYMHCLENRVFSLHKYFPLLSSNTVVFCLKVQHGTSQLLVFMQNRMMQLPKSML